MELPAKKWGDTLLSFSDLTKSKKYMRVDYRTKWVKLVAPPSPKVVIQKENSTIKVQINKNTSVNFTIDDGSFGEFLYDTILQEEEKSMPPRNENETWSYTTDSITSAIDNIIASSNAFNKTTSEWKIAAEDIGKVCDGLSPAPDWTVSDSTANKASSGYPNALRVARDGTIRIGGTLSTNSYDDVDVAISTRPTFDDVKQMIKEEITNNKEKKEMKGFNFDFGPCTNDNVRMSIYGLAIKNTAGVWVSYNDGAIVDVDCFNFEGGKYMFKIPVAVSAIASGDVIIHNKVPMFVSYIEDDEICAVDIRDGEVKTIIPTSNMFGFNFVTKIVSLFDTLKGAPTPEQPFGGMLPFVMMGEDKDFDPMMMFFLMQDQKSLAANPMLMYMMMNKGKEFDPMMMLLFTQNGALFPTKANSNK